MTIPDQTVRRKFKLVCKIDKEESTNDIVNKIMNRLVPVTAGSLLGGSVKVRRKIEEMMRSKRVPLEPLHQMLSIR